MSAMSGSDGPPTLLPLRRTRMTASLDPIVYDAARLLQAFPSIIYADASGAVNQFAFWTRRSYQSCQFAVTVLGEQVQIPQRLHLSGFTLQPCSESTAGFVKACLRTRSTDGFERQQALTGIIGANEPWTIPFVIALVGEYVIEILDDIFGQIDRLDPLLVGRFLHENRRFHFDTGQRVASYWNAYYRHIPRSDYVGFKIMRELNAMARTWSASH
jgi:hypothetical protein